MKKFIVFLTQPPQLTCVVVTHRKQINHFLNTSFTSRPHMPMPCECARPTSIWSHKYEMSLELKHSCTARCLIVSITHFCKYLLIFFFFVPLTHSPARLQLLFIFKVIQNEEDMKRENMKYFVLTLFWRWFASQFRWMYKYVIYHFGACWVLCVLCC